MTASPQPGNQDERACACGHPIGVHMPEEIPAGPGERRCWATGPCDCTRYVAAAAAGETGAGEEADDVHEQAVAAFEADHREQQTVYEAHEWTSSDPDTCARCDVEWGDADATCAESAPSAGRDTERRCGRCGQIPYVHGLPDSTCVYEPTQAAGQDTERLRDEGPAYDDLTCHRGRHEDGGLYCSAHGQSWPCTDPRLRDEMAAAIQNANQGSPWWIADALLHGPLRQLIAERDDLRRELDQARAQVQRVREFADELAEDSRTAKRLADEARARGDREMQRINMRHARVAHHAAEELRRALDPT